MISRNILGFSVTSNMTKIMDCNGFYASIMKAEKKKKDNDGLPLGMPIPILPVDALKSRPDFWIGGQGSYVCPVDSDWGLWFNFEMNNSSNTSVLASVKGMNPITGQRINGLELEKYQNKCPVHKVDFKHGRLCTKCGFKWPEQNYLSSPTPFYLDGFRDEDGSVRQFFFTDEMAKSIPELVIGKDDTIPAFGFCFYNLKDMDIDFEAGKRLKGKSSEKYFKNRETMIQNNVIGIGTTGCGGTSSRISSISLTSYTDCTKSGYGSTTTCYYSDTSDEIIPDSFSIKTSGEIGLGKSSRGLLRLKSFKSRKSKEVGIGAGSKIQQELMKDIRSLDSWQEKPSSIMRIYFVFQEQFEKYAEAGLNSLEGSKNGYMNELPVGVEK